jgi:hypothetical protein
MFATHINESVATRCSSSPIASLSCSVCCEYLDQVDLMPRGAQSSLKLLACTRTLGLCDPPQCSLLSRHCVLQNPPVFPAVGKYLGCRMTTAAPASPNGSAGVWVGKRGFHFLLICYQSKGFSTAPLAHSNSCLSQSLAKPHIIRNSL